MYGFILHTVGRGLEVSIDDGWMNACPDAPEYEMCVVIPRT